MGQPEPELIDLLEDKVLGALPEAALDKLLAIPDDGANHEIEIMDILQANNVDPATIARNLKEAA